MKTILVLTDFSANARNAAEAAIMMASKTGADILVFNAYIRLPFVAWPPEYYTAFKDDSTDHIREEVKRLQKISSDFIDIPNKPDITCLNTEGTLAEGLKNILKERNIELIVMGARDKTIGDFIFGNSINEVIDTVNVPVLIVPNKKTVLNIKNVVFATDLSVQDVTGVKYVAGLSKDIHFHLNICHVSSPAIFIPDFNEEDRVSAFTAELSKLNFGNVSYHNLEGSHVIQELADFYNKANADLFAFVHKKHSVLWQIFHAGSSKILVKHQKNLMLVLPDHWEKKAIHSAPVKKASKIVKSRLSLL
jgi:nucleotide-binding universal stress UspA family protein